MSGGRHGNKDRGDFHRVQNSTRCSHRHRRKMRLLTVRILLNCVPLAASTAPFLCRILDHREWPEAATLVVDSPLDGPASAIRGTALRRRRPDNGLESERADIVQCSLRRRGRAKETSDEISSDMPSSGKKSGGVLSRQNKPSQSPHYAGRWAASPHGARHGARRSGIYGCIPSLDSERRTSNRHRSRHDEHMHSPRSYSVG